MGERKTFLFMSRSEVKCCQETRQVFYKTPVTLGSCSRWGYGKPRQMTSLEGSKWEYGVLRTRTGFSYDEVSYEHNV